MLKERDGISYNVVWAFHSWAKHKSVLNPRFKHACPTYRWDSNRSAYREEFELINQRTLGVLMFYFFLKKRKKKKLLVLFFFFLIHIRFSLSLSLSKRKTTIDLSIIKRHVLNSTNKMRTWKGNGIFDSWYLIQFFSYNSESNACHAHLGQILMRVFMCIPHMK